MNLWIHEDTIFHQTTIIDIYEFKWIHSIVIILIVVASYKQ
jgi:hypothetical protein